MTISLSFNLAIYNRFAIIAISFPSSLTPRRQIVGIGQMSLASQRVLTHSVDLSIGFDSPFRLLCVPPKTEGACVLLSRPHGSSSSAQEFPRDLGPSFRHEELGTVAEQWCYAAAGQLGTTAETCTRKQLSWGASARPDVVPADVRSTTQGLYWAAQSWPQLCSFPPMRHHYLWVAQMGMVPAVSKGVGLNSDGDEARKVPLTLSYPFFEQLWGGGKNQAKVMMLCNQWCL